MGILAATILFIATNAGVIGASRITYAMAGYRQIPATFRRLHPRFRTPWLALVLFAGAIPILTLLPGQTDFLGTMYSFGATLSFTIAHASIVALRYRFAAEEVPFRARPNLRARDVDWPLFAVFGGIGTLIAWLVIVVQEPVTRWAGIGWLLFGFVAYAIYRRRFVHAGLRETVRAPQIVLGPGLEIEYRTILVPVSRSPESEEALVAAARLAAERRAAIAVLRVLEIPLELPLDADLPDEEDEAHLLLDEARAFVEAYGVRAVPRLVRARRAGPAIVEEAAGRNAELVVVGAARRRARRGHPVFGATVDHVLRASPSRVLVTAARGRVMARAGLWATVVLSALMAVLGVVLIVETALVDGSLGFLIGALPRRREPAPLPRYEEPLMARKLPGLKRVLGPSSIASVAYAEIGSSVYFALGIVALYALGLTPWVLLGVGLVILLVTASYAEAASAVPETGGTALFVARAFNDPVGFLTGWVLFLDYLIVIALAGLFVPHYVGTALGWEAVTREPWDGILGVCVILGVAGFRLVRRAELYRIAVAVAALALFTHLLLIVLGLGFVFSPSDLTDVELGTAPAWGDLAFALALATLAYTGLETVANLAAEAREPGKTLPRSFFAAIGLVVLVTAAIGLVSVSVPDVSEELEAPLVAIVDALEGQLPAWFVDVLRVFVGLGAAVVLVAAITTGISGAGRLAYALGRHEMLPHAFARLNRRTLLAPAAILSTAGLASALLLVVDAAGRDVRFFGSLYSFGILLALTAAQLAVVRLRFTEPGLHRPYRAPWNVTVRGVQVPCSRSSAPCSPSRSGSSPWRRTRRRAWLARSGSCSASRSTSRYAAPGRSPSSAPSCRPTRTSSPKSRPSTGACSCP